MKKLHTLFVWVPVLIAAGFSTANSQAAVLTTANIGNPAIAGTVTSVGSGYDIVAAGTNIFYTADQFTFGYEQIAGDFDLNVRAQSLSASEPWAKAGLMARESLNANSRFAASLAGPNIAGANFTSRLTNGASATSSGSYPVNYPYTWLRLKRTGNTMTGYASLDGQNWTVLGTLTFSALPATMYVGLAGCSANAAQTATAQLRDYGAVVGGVIVPFIATREPLGPSSRRTGLVISEIMYHPKDRPDGKQLEFIEIYNSMSIFEDISGYKLTGDVEYTIPNGTVLQAGKFLVLAKIKSDVESAYGITGVLEYGITNGFNTNVVGNTTNITANIDNALSNGGGTLKLIGRASQVLLDASFSTKYPWPIEADGAGHSLVLARPSYGEGDRRAWDASDVIGGSPGSFDPVTTDPARNVVINEFLAHTDPPLEDMIELYNHGTTPVDISGFWLSDDPGTNKFRIPNGTVLPARGFISFTAVSSTNYSPVNTSFALSASGEQIFLLNSNQNRVIQAIGFEGQENGVSMGRYPDGAPSLRRLSAVTAGTTNAAPLTSPVVINEIMYNPISGNSDDEFVELYNRSSGPVNLGNWQFNDGISFTFPPNTILQPGAYLVVAKDATRLKNNYNNLSSANLIGNYGGSLANSGEHLALAAPDYEVTTNGIGQVTTNVSFHFVVNEVTYGTSGRWGNWSDGGGSSLELVDPRSDNSLAANWADSDETAKASWTSFEFTGTIDNVFSAQGANDNLQVFMLGIGECLVDDVELRGNTPQVNLIANSGFESGLTSWTRQGSHDRSFIDNTGFSGKSLHIVAQSRGDNQANRIRGALTTPVSSATATLRAKARWLRGFPEVLLRIHGGGLEAFGRMPVPANLGTPGAANSRSVTNAGPAIDEVTHSPALPQVGDAVRVTARVNDPDGVSQLVIRYRVDPGTTLQSATMVDNGTGGDAVAGDGLFTGTIPAQSSGTMIAFYIQGVDNTGVTNSFPANATRLDLPNDSPTHECLVRWGEIQMPGSFATYHIWITDGTATRWTGRDRLNNSQLDGTFVYNNTRVVYNMKPQYAGSPWHSGQMTGPLNQGSRQDYVMNFNKEEMMLGVTDFVLNTPGNPSGNDSSDSSAMAEQISYETFKAINIHYNYRRYIHLFLNGFQRSISGNRSPGNFIMEDSQQPNGDAIEEWFPGETDGQLYKIEDWFEFADNGLTFSNDDADLGRRTTTYNGVSSLKIAPYRFMWRKRSVSAGDSANDYTNFLAMVDIVSPASNPNSTTLSDTVVKQFGQVADFEQWMRIFAVQHTCGNWDSYGYNRGKNAYTYRPERGGFNQWTWDIDFTMGVGGDGASTGLFGTTDGRLGAMYNTPETLRAYWRAYRDIANGPLNLTYMDPQINGRLAAFRANNINVDPNVALNTIRSFITARHDYIVSQLATVAANFNVPTTNFTTSSNIVTITGTAPIDVKFIEINGVTYPITWTGTTAWSIRLPMSATGSNGFVLQAFDRLTNPIPSTTRTLGVNFTGVIESPETNIVFNEIMANPLVPGAEYVELFNRSANFTFDIAGWRINGLDYTFPEGATLGPRAFLVLTKDRVAFGNAYGGSVQAYGQFAGELQTDGETLTLIKPATSTNTADLIVDRVRYEGALPWPTAANGTGSSFQLLDASQENARAGNWFSSYVPPVYSEPVSTPAQVFDGWRFVSATGNVGTGAGGQQMRLVINLGQGEVNGASAIIDDISIVAGTNATVGYNFVRNGDFESGPLLEVPALTNSWYIGTNYTNTAIIGGLTHGGNGALRIDCQTFGNSFPRVISQLLSPAPLTNAIHTISFWFWATNSATNLTVKLLQSGPVNVTTNVNIYAIASNYVPPMVIIPATNTLSPGTTNQPVVTLPAFPPLWINELQADNTAGIVDNAGQHDPWIEIYNTSTNSVSLNGLYLSSSYTNLTSWAFPAGASIGPKQFLVVFCDAQPAQTSGAEYHTSFRLPSSSGSIALSRIYSNAPQVLDYVNYRTLPADRSYGSYPDGQPFDRMDFFYVTAGVTNNGRSAPLVVFINEWMASNTNYLADPADNDYDDWFELYNPGTNQVDIAGYYLSDSSTNGLGVVTNKFKYLITTDGPHIIPPLGFLLVWADNETGQNSSGGIPRSDLHVNFQLSAGGEAIGLFAADGTQIDFVAFTNQQRGNVSEGRYPNGQATIYAMTNATPRLPNYIAGVGNYAPFLNPIGDKYVFVNQAVVFTATAFDLDPGQMHAFTLDAGAPPNAFLDLNTGAFNWTPTSPGTYIVPVRVTDNGAPPLDDYENVVVHVSSLPSITGPALSGTDLTLSWLGAAGRTYQVQYKDILSDLVGWQPFGQPLTVESDAILSISDDIRNSPQRFFRVIVLP